MQIRKANLEDEESGKVMSINLRGTVVEHERLGERR
jgi:hypothetical protein